ncbi:hypothetical protein JCM31271_30980 [Halorubrum trueperi]
MLARHRDLLRGGRQSEFAEQLHAARTRDESEADFREAEPRFLVGACRGLPRRASRSVSSGGKRLRERLGPVIEEADDLSQPLGEVWSDGLPAYREMEHDHLYVVHDDGYVSEEGVYTNQAQCLWSLLRPWLARLPKSVFSSIVWYHRTENEKTAHKFRSNLQRGGWRIMIIYL